MFEVELKERADASVAAVVASQSAEAAGFSSAEAAAMATVAAELASNAVRHGGGGAMRIAVDAEALRIVVVDRGPGSAALLRRKLSQPHAPGADHGLGTVQRFADGVELSDRPEGGIAVAARFDRRRVRR